MRVLDTQEEKLVEKTGVFYRGSPEPWLRLCNRTKRAMRVASAIQFVPRASALGDQVEPEYIVRGWGELDVDACKAVRVGGSGTVFLYIESRLLSGTYLANRYATEGRLEDFTLQALRDREYRVLRSDIEFCASTSEDFDVRSSAFDKVSQNCAAGTGLLKFPLFVQFAARTNQTIDLQ